MKSLEKIKRNRAKKRHNPGNGKFECVDCGGEKFSSPFENDGKTYVRCLSCRKKVPHPAGVKIDKLGNPRGFAVTAV